MMRAMTAKQYAWLLAALAAGLLAAGPLPAQEAADNSLADAIMSGDAGIALRYRYEHVDQDGFDENANASTLRLRLDYRTGSWRDLTAFAQFDYVGELFLRDFNNLSGSSPDRDRYPVVADAKGPDLNELYLDYDPGEDTRIRLGRQRILLDNQRFVGGVGWRQNEQTYDSGSITYDGVANMEVFYSYVAAVRRIFGTEVTSGRHENNTHLLNVNIALSENWNVIPYYYAIDNSDAAAFSTRTLGARVTGKVPLAAGSLGLVAEIATQSDAADNPVSYDAEYFHLAANWTINDAWTVGLALESLGGDQNLSGAAFRTPLATLHAFQGWADKFLATPDAGIEDWFATVRYNAGKWNLTAVYHDFSAESGSQDWGTELDLSAGRKLGDRYGVLFKAALYDADEHQTDTTKFWIMLTAAY